MIMPCGFSLKASCPLSSPAICLIVPLLSSVALRSTTGHRFTARELDNELEDVLLAARSPGVVELLCKEGACSDAELEFQDPNMELESSATEPNSSFVLTAEATPLPECLDATMHSLFQAFEGSVPDLVLNQRPDSYSANKTGVAVLEKLVAGVNSAIYSYNSQAGNPWPSCKLEHMIMKVHHSNPIAYGYIMREEWRYRRRAPYDVCVDEMSYQNKAADVGVAPRVYQMRFSKAQNDSGNTYCIHAVQKASGPGIMEWLSSNPSMESRKAWAKHYKSQVWKLNWNAGVTHGDLHSGNAMFDCPGGQVTEKPSDTCKLLIVDFEFADDRSSWFMEGGDRKRTYKTIKNGLSA